MYLTYRCVAKMVVPMHCPFFFREEDGVGKCLSFSLVFKLMLGKSLILFVNMFNWLVCASYIYFNHVSLV